MSRPTLEDPTGDVDRVLAALRPEFGEVKLTAPLAVIRRATHVMREAIFKVTAVVAERDGCREMIDLLSGHGANECLGVGIDVGTTTVTLYLVDTASGAILENLALDNPQAAHGEDILTRIHFCQNKGGLDILRDLIVACLNSGIEELAGNRGVKPESIYVLSIAGNPTMTHLLLGLDPYYLCREPYAPVVNRPLLLTAKELGLNAHPEAPAYVFPSLGSYFGGDVVAGILASGMHRMRGASLFVDVGTNAEIVVGNREWLVMCAGAAGPALESGGAKAGMRAVSGAIDRVRIDRGTLEPSCSVIGGGAPTGICGSGLIDLVAELYLAGIIDPTGRFTEALSERIVTGGGVKGYALALARKGEAADDIVVDEIDIRNLLRAKAAMYTALSLVTERLGLGFDDIETFYVAGSFGEHIDPRSAIALGMLPDIPLGRFRALGNSAGLGACLMLHSFSLREDVEAIRAKAAYIQLTTDAEFMNRLNAAMFIPHTNRELFPSVRRSCLREIPD
jgi:uncharacterized 2Fe-2S/4Fe-4S cluster protein (DUF4445 family)